MAETTTLTAVWNPEGRQDLIPEDPRGFAWARIEGDKVYFLSNAFFTCKDYMTEMLVENAEDLTTSPENRGVWRKRFLWWAGKTIDWDHTTIARSVGGMWDQNFHLFQAYEKELGLEPTKVFKVTNYPHLRVLQGDKWWQTTTIHNSLYCSWIRNMASPKIMKSLDDPSGLDGYLFTSPFIKKRIFKLPLALQKLSVSQVRNSASKLGMHGMNGHFYLFSSRPIVRRNDTVYGEQLEKIDPTLFLSEAEHAATMKSIYGTGYL
jgi:hypothetical protein